MKRIFVLMCSICLILTGCNSTKPINIDNKLANFQNIEYNKKLLDKEFIDETKEKEITNTDSIIAYSLVDKLEFPSNALPSKFLFSLNLKEGIVDYFDMWNNKWAMTAYTHDTNTTSVIYTISFDDIETAKENIYKASEGFLKTYGNIVFEGNVMAFDFESLKMAPIILVSDCDQFYAMFKVGYISGRPAAQVSYFKKGLVHSLDSTDNQIRVKELMECLKSVNISPAFTTVELTMNQGYIVNRELDEDLTEADKLNKTYIFTK